MSGPVDPLLAAFEEAYGRPPQGVWHAPGRVNLIGEHTDYNDGLVLPFALAQGVSVAAARRDDGVLELRSLQAAADGRTVRVEELTPGAVDGWAAYPAGVAAVLREHGVGGASLLIDSDLPQGAGLASSAALECAVALALCQLHGVEIERAELARLAQRAEREFTGTPCGIMDQSAALLCTAGHALLLDCRSGLSSQVPLPLGEALSLLVVLRPEETVELLGQRLEALSAQAEETRARIRGATEQGVAWVFLVEEQYRLALLEAEMRFVTELRRDLARPDYVRQWEERFGSRP